MTLWALFAGFFRVGLFGFGGGPSFIPLMQKECVAAGWITEERFLEALAAGNALPGPITTKMALWIGYDVAGPAGAFVSLVGLLLPSSVLIGALGAFLVRNREHWAVSASMKGAQPAVVAMLAWTAFELAPSGLKGGPQVAIALAAFVALAAKVHPALVIVGAAVAGLLLFKA